MLEVQFLQLNIKQLQNLHKTLPILAIGKLLQATVSKGNNGLSLLLQGHKIPIKTDLPLKEGQQLSLKVTEIGENIVLKIQDAKVTLDNTAKQQILQSALKSAIPKQDSYAGLLANLEKLDAKFKGPIKNISQALINHLPTKSDILIPKVLKTAIQNSGTFLEAKLSQAIESQVKQDLPKQLQSDLKANLMKLQGSLKENLSQTIMPEKQATLQQAMITKQKGVIESTIQQTLTKGQTNSHQTQASSTATSTAAQHHTAQNPKTTPNHQAIQAYQKQPDTFDKPIPIPSKGQMPKPQATQVANIDLQDPKGTLMKLASQTESALARMQLHQMASLANQGDTVQNTWLVEMPIRDQTRTDILQMTIEERDPTTPERLESESQWDINLAIELEHLGAMQAAIQLQGNQLKISLWHESSDTQYLVQSELDDLYQELRKHDFTVEQLQVFSGLNDTIQFKPFSQLVDEKI